MGDDKSRKGGSIKPSTGEPLSLPESKETLAMQLKQLADGKRSAVFVAEGSPKVLVPRGMNTIPTHEGRIHFNPKFVSASHVHQAIANGRLSDLLGYVQNKAEAIDNSLRSGGMPKFVVSRDANGVEQDAAAVSPDRVHEQAQIFAHRAKPGSRVGIEDSSKTIASRENAFKGGRKKYQDGGGPIKEALDLAFRNKKLPQMLDTVLDVPRKAAEMYPFIAKNKPNTKINIRPDNNWAETYNPGETGDPRKPVSERRPKEFPINETGVEIYRPDFSPADYAAEYLHVDPVANRARDLLTKTIRPDQMRHIKEERDYEESLRQGQSLDRALQNQIDGMLRGYVMQNHGYLPNEPVRPATDVFDKQHQQPAFVVEEMKYSPEQKNILEDLKRYTTQRAVGGPVMHDDIMNALRLANERQGYADGGAPMTMGAPRIGLPMGAPAIGNQIMRTFQNYGQPADQATIDNIAGRIRAGDFSLDQFNDWAHSQYGNQQGGAGAPPGNPFGAPSYNPGYYPGGGQPDLGPPPGSTPVDYGGPFGRGGPPNLGPAPGSNPELNDNLFLPPRPNMFYPGEGSGIVSNGGVGDINDFTRQQMGQEGDYWRLQNQQQNSQPQGNLSGLLNSALGQVGQMVPMQQTPQPFQSQSTSGLKSDADFQRDLQNQLSALGGANQSALAMTNPFLGNNPMKQGTGYVYNGDGGLDQRYGGPGTSQAVPDPGSVALPASAPPSTPTNPGGMSMGSGLKNGPSQNFGGGGGFSSGLKNGPGRNYGQTPTSGGGFGG